MEKSIPILKKLFFPKWLITLNTWLNLGERSDEKSKEIQKWYEGWKNLFLKNYFQFDEIKKEFKDALILIFKHNN
jgi:hypothetical protein